MDGGVMTKEDILTQAEERFRTASTADMSERALYDTDLRFALDYEGCQWDAALRASREGGYPPRPCLSINKIPEKIDMIEGEVLQLSPSVKIRPVDDKADPQVATILGGLVKHIEYNSNAKSAYANAYRSVLYGGRGAWRIDVVDSQDDPFVREIQINRIANVLTVYWDPEASKEDRSDAEYIFVTEFIPESDFKKQYPSEGMVDWPVAGQWEGWRTEKGCRIAEYWYKVREKKTFYQVQREVGGFPVVMTVDKLWPGEEALREKSIEVPVVYWCKLTAGRILDGPNAWPVNDIPIFVMSGKEINVGGVAHSRGMVRYAKTPQRMYNYWSSAVTETVALAPKSPYLMTGEMLGPYKAMWDDAHMKNYPYLLYQADTVNPGARPTREMPPQLSTALASELQRQEHDIMSTMGIYQASLGDKSQELSGRAILARQKQGNIGTYAYTDNFETALTYSTKVLIKLIPHVYDTERIVRIMGDNDEQINLPINAQPGSMRTQQVVGDMPQLQRDKYLSKPREGVSNYLNDLTVGKYDVVVTIGPSYATQRQEVMATMMDLLKIVPPQMAMAMAPVIVQNMDMPHSEKLIDIFNRISGVGPDGQPIQAPPDPKLIIEAQKMQLAEMEQARKDFETQVNALKTIAEADAINRDQTMRELTAVMMEVKEIMTGQGQQANMNMPPPGPETGGIMQ
jgi:hypothetical protein